MGFNSAFEELKEQVRMWFGFMWLRIRSSGGLLRTWYWTFRFHIRQ